MPASDRCDRESVGNPSPSATVPSGEEECIRASWQQIPLCGQIKYIQL